MSQFTYQPLNLYDNYRQASLKFPEVAIYLDQALPAFPELGLSTTYGESLILIDQRANQLAALGIQAGDKVMVFKSPAFDTYLLAVALTRLGAVPVMVSYHLSPQVIEVLGQRLGQGHGLIYDEVTAPTIAALEGGVPSRYWSVKSILAAPKDLEAVKGDFESGAIAYITHTSGTTGIPKLICHSTHTMGWRILLQKRVLDQMQERRLCTFLVSPVHSRFNIGISSLMTLGFPMMPLAKADLDSVALALERYPAYAIETHPNHFVQWRQLAKQRPELFRSAKYYHSTFDAINHATMACFLEASKANHPIFLQIYGQSECGPMIIKPHRLRSLPESDARDMGVGLPGLTEARIADSQGNLLPVGQAGHIQFLSKGRALTYYQEDERFQATVYGDWWDSGDYGYMDEAGHLYLQDRQVDLIEDLPSTLALEDILLDRLDCLSEVVIIRDAQGFAQPVVALNQGQTMDWDRWWRLTADMSHLNEPIIMDWEALPRTATMKIQRLALHDQLFGEKSGSIINGVGG